MVKASKKFLKNLESRDKRFSRNQEPFSHKIALQFNVQFLCERVPAKIDYSKKAFPDVKFIFSDMRDLSREKAHDALTNKIQDVPEAARLSLAM